METGFVLLPSEAHLLLATKRQILTDSAVATKLHLALLKGRTVQAHPSVAGNTDRNTKKNNTEAQWRGERSRGKAYLWFNEWSVSLGNEVVSTLGQAGPVRGELGVMAKALVVEM